MTPAGRPSLTHSSSQTSKTSSLSVGVGDGHDADLEMVDSQPADFSSPLPWQTKPNNSISPPPTFLAPPPAVNQSVSISGGRIATPIYGHFGTDVSMDLGAEDNAPAAASVSIATIMEEDESKWWRRRRLPSPASEDGGDPGSLVSPVDEDGGMLGRLNMSSSAEDLTNNATHGEEMVFTRSENGDWSRQGIGGGLLARRVRSDRRGSETQQPSHGKMSLSMGFRADCDKCQRRVPGHYSHIIRN